MYKNVRYSTSTLTYQNMFSIVGNWRFNYVFLCFSFQIQYMQQTTYSTYSWSNLRIQKQCYCIQIGSS